MPVEVTMPRLSDTMEQGTVVSWNVSEGDEVSAGDVLGDIETDKATMELQNFDDGVVAAILVGEGETVEVGKAIVVLAEEGEEPAEVKKSFRSGAAGGEADASSAAAEPARATAEAGGGESAGGGGANGSAATMTADDGAAAGAGGDGGSGGGSGGGRIFASPLAKKIAAEKGLDLANIRGTGPSGRIVRKDVEEAGKSAESEPAPAAAAGQAPAAGGAPSAPTPAPQPVDVPLEDKTINLSNMRATIARRLVESKTSIPHYQVTMTARVDALIDLRKQLNEQLSSQGVKLSVNDFIIRAGALAMHQHPHTNASWTGDGRTFRLNGHVNVGVAIALPLAPDGTGGGLVVGTLRDADKMGLRSISAETKRLATKAREKGLTIEEMSDATFTISNLGMYGVEHYTAIINPPNVAILAVGAAMKRPVVGEDGELTVGYEMDMTMSSDHRVIDGAMAAQYLQTVKRLLEAPATLLV